MFDTLSKRWLDWLYNFVLVCAAPIVLCLLLAPAAYCVIREKLPASMPAVHTTETTPSKKELLAKSAPVSPPGNTLPPPTEAASPLRGGTPEAVAGSAPDGIAELFKTVLPLLSIIFALLGGIVLKFARDAIEDIKKQVEAAKKENQEAQDRVNKIFDEAESRAEQSTEEIQQLALSIQKSQRLMEFQVLRASLIANTATEMVRDAVTINGAGNLEEHWKTLSLREHLFGFYELAESFGASGFEAYELVNFMDNIIGVNEELRALFREQPKHREFLEKLVELAKADYPEIACSARHLLNQLWAN